MAENQPIYQPELLVIAGPNGAGKTTAAMTLLKDYVKILDFVNADEIARGLSPLQPEKVAIQAGKLVLKRINQLIEDKKDFALETTASGNIHAKTMRKCLDAGYRVKIAFVYVDTPKLLVNRVKLRVSKGGHDVSEQDIIRRYHAGLKRFFSQYKALAHEWILYDNTHNGLREIAHFRQDMLSVFEDELWQRLKEKYDDEKSEY